MSNAKHKPGEWKFEDECVRDNEGNIVADVYTMPTAEAGDQMEANARLIAAAPELLQGIQDAAWRLRQMADEVQEPFRTKLLDMATELGLLDEQATA